MFKTIAIIIPISNASLSTISKTFLLKPCYGLFATLCGQLALRIIVCNSIQSKCSSVKPFFSALSAWLYFRKRTPMKKLRKKKLPIKMKRMKNAAWYV